jgi:murein DD-endopeptidase / murein LD-carboxypeptidase
MARAGEIVARARALIGVRFRPQGRSIEHGLDCIGVAAMATGMSRDEAPRHYNLRTTDVDEANRQFDESGFVRIAPAAAETGDIVLTLVGGGQLHVAILTPEGYLHADARLRRVAEAPGPVPWPVLSAWRYPDDEALTPPPGRRA